MDHAVTVPYEPPRGAVRDGAVAMHHLSMIEPPRARANKRAAILRAATYTFTKQGYRATNINAIAEAASVSKRTIYAHFGSKRQLFLTVLHDARSRANATAAIGAAPFDDPTRLRDDLTTFGERHLRTMLHPELCALRRIMIREVIDQQQVLHDALDGAPRRLDEWLTGRLRGLGLPEPERATRVFTTLISHEAQMRSTYWTTTVGDDEIRAIAEDAADVVTRALGGP